MNRDNGFSLSEVLVALIILSLCAVLLSQTTANMMGSWDRAGAYIESTRIESSDLDEIEILEASLITEQGVPHGPTLEIDDGPPLILSNPRLNQTADCIYDLVGRRCR